MLHFFQEEEAQSILSTLEKSAPPAGSSDGVYDRLVSREQCNEDNKSSTIGDPQTQV